MNERLTQFSTFATTIPERCLATDECLVAKICYRVSPANVEIAVPEVKRLMTEIGFIPEQTEEQSLEGRAVHIQGICEKGSSEGVADNSFDIWQEEPCGRIRFSFFYKT